MFATIFRYECRHWLRQPLPYLFGSMLFGLAFLVMWGMSADGKGDPQALAVNSHFRLQYIANYFSVLLLFLLPGTVGASIYRDYSSQMFSVLYAYPLRRWPYLAAKFSSSFLVVTAVTLALGVGFALGPLMPYTNPDAVLPFSWAPYVYLYGVLIIPNLILLASLVFALVIIVRNIYVAFIGVVLVVIIQALVISALVGIGDGYYAALLDPFANATLQYMIQDWTIAQKNTAALPFSGIIFYNRILYLVLAGCLCAWSYIRFDFQQFTAGKKRKNKQVVFPQEQQVISPMAPSFQFDFLAKLGVVWRTSRLEFRHIVSSWPFITILFIGFIYVFLQQEQMNPMYGFELLPTTGRMLRMPLFLFSLVINLLTFLYMGVLLYRGQTSGMSDLIDASPQPASVLLGSKLLAVAKMQMLLLTVIGLSGVITQLLSGYPHHEWGHYLLELYVLQFIHFFIWACLAVLLHTLLQNMYLSFFLLLLVPFGLQGMGEVGKAMGWDFLTEDILAFNAVPGVTVGFEHSVFTGYGTMLTVYAVFKTYWFFLAMIFLVLTLLFWKRGYFFSWRERWVNAKGRFQRPLRPIFFSLLGGFLLLGGILYYQQHYVARINFTQADEDAGLAEYEKRYGHFLTTIQPKITAANIQMDIYPSDRSYKARGQLFFVNKVEQALDTILVATSFKDATDFSFRQANKLISQDTQLRFAVFQLNSALAPGDTLIMDFTLHSYPNSWLTNNSRVVTNGTYLTAHILPQLGLRDIFLRDAAKRKTYGLGERQAPQLLPSDTSLLGYAFAGNNMDRIDYETIVSTSANQQAFSMGDLVRDWVEDDRHYFHYRSNGPISNTISWMSGHYAMVQDSSAGVQLQLYYHPMHTENLDNLMDGMKAVVAEGNTKLGKLQHDTLRLVEYPSSVGTYATLNGNLLPFSEGYFLCDVDNDKNDIFNVPYYIATHELSHYWWGHRVDPANVRGGRFITEGLAEYTAMRITERTFGAEKVLGFRQKMFRIYRRKHIQRRDEDPLVTAPGSADYLNYRKGGLLLYSLSQYIGEERFDAALAAFEQRYRFSTPPYATALDFVDTLRAYTPDSLQYLVKDFFESVTFYTNAIQQVDILQQSDGSYLAKVELSVNKELHNKDGTTTELPLSDYVEVGYYQDDEKGQRNLIELQRILVKHTNEVITVELPSLATMIEIDPRQLLFELDRQDNVWKTD